MAATWIFRGDVSPSSGRRRYYFHAATEATQWERPADFVSPWEARTDPASGATYYYHAQTHESKWETPPGVE